MKVLNTLFNRVGSNNRMTFCNLLVIETRSCYYIVPQFSQRRIDTIHVQTVYYRRTKGLGDTILARRPGRPSEVQWQTLSSLLAKLRAMQSKCCIAPLPSSALPSVNLSSQPSQRSQRCKKYARESTAPAIEFACS